MYLVGSAIMTADTQWFISCANEHGWKYNYDRERELFISNAQSDD